MHAAIRTWAYEQLREKGIYALDGFEDVRLMPWSSVYRVQTDQGFFYLKHVQGEGCYEAQLLLMLETHFEGMVPSLLASSGDLSCFILRDAGETLRTYLGRAGYDVTLIKKVFDAYCMIQRTMESQVDALMSAGVPDWRLQTFTKRYEHFLQDTSFLSGIGIDKTVHKTLTSLGPQVYALCETIDRVGVRETLEHADFQDNNVLIRNDRFVISDWGDAVISHPFFSLASFLRSAERNHAIATSLRQELESSYLHHWMNRYSEDEILKAYRGIIALQDIKWVMNFHHATLENGSTAYMPFKDSILKSVLDFKGFFEIA